MTNQQLMAVQKIGLSILETIQDQEGDGVPGGIIYAALMTQGASLGQFNSLMDGLVSKKMITKEFDNYYITDSGRVFIEKLKSKLAIA